MAVEYSRDFQFKQVPAWAFGTSGSFFSPESFEQVPAMLILIRILLVLYGLIAMVTGYMGTTATYNAALNDPMQDNNHRFVAAIWGIMSFAFFYVAWYPSETTLFRFLMAAVFIGGIVRALALVNYPPTPFIIFGIAIELIPTTLMLWMHTLLLNKGIL